MRIASLVAAGFVAASPAITLAQGSDTLSMQGRSAFSLGFGLTGTRSQTVTTGGVAQHASGQIGSIAFTHWIRPALALELSGAVLNADQTVSGNHVHDNAILPILFGLTVTPRALALSPSIRPYVSVAAGPYIHAVSDVNGRTTNSSTETVAGARFAGGANWFIARHFLFGVEGNYNAVGAFDQPDGVTEKPSGFGLAMKVGFAWGGR